MALHLLWGFYNSLVSLYPSLFVCPAFLSLQSILSLPGDCAPAVSFRPGR